MATRLIECLAATGPLSQVFSDRGVLQAMLDVEVALARAQAAVGVVPPDAAGAIAAAAVADGFDLDALSRASLRAGTPAIPLVRMLRARVRELDAAAADFVHHGATSQDVVDTALVLLLRESRAVLEADHERLLQSLRARSDEHARTVMLGRTLLQPAPPVTFGLKVAGWYGALDRTWSEVARAFEGAACVQFGGASGTLAALGDRGPAVADALAAALGLSVPPAPWHGHRDRFAALAAALGIYTGSLGKMALDIALLMQFEVGEVSEPAGGDRGGSSSMPHKRNPIACMLALGAAKRTPGLVASVLGGLMSEHERAVGGWQSEWVTMAGIVQAAGVAVEAMAEVAGGLSVDVARMRGNIDATRGAVFSERAALMLAQDEGYAAARQLVEESLEKTGAPPDLPGLRAPEQYLGSAEAFRRRLLGAKE